MGLGPGGKALTALAVGPGGKSLAAWASGVPSAARASAVAVRSLGAEMTCSLRLVPDARGQLRWTPAASSLGARRAGEPARRSPGTRPPHPVGFPPPRLRRRRADLPGSSSRTATPLPLARCCLCQRTSRKPELNPRLTGDETPVRSEWLANFNASNPVFEDRAQHRVL